MEMQLTESKNYAYKSTSSLFKSLTAEEVQEFQMHARESYVVGSPINEVWHPVYKAECMEMNAEAKDKLENRWNSKQ